MHGPDPGRFLLPGSQENGTKPGMYVLRDRLITAEIRENVQHTETCYFVNKRLKTGNSAFSAVSNGVEPNQSYTLMFVNIITILPSVLEVVNQFI